MTFDFFQDKKQTADHGLNLAQLSELGLSNSDNGLKDRHRH
jgi:hypothetical protein